MSLKESLSNILFNVINGKQIPKQNFISLYTIIYEYNDKKQDLILFNIFSSSVKLVVTPILQDLQKYLGKPEYYNLVNTARIKIQKIDEICSKLVRGRNWLLSNYPEISQIGTFIFEMEMKKIDKNWKSSNTQQSDKIISQTPIPNWKFTQSKNLIYNISLKLQRLNNTDSIKKTDIKLSTELPCFILENVLTLDECEYLIRESKKIGYESLKTEFPQQERDNNRVLLNSEELASELWNRIKEFIYKIPNLKQLRPFGFNNQGTWEPCRLNSCFRFCEYVAPSIGLFLENVILIF